MGWDFSMELDAGGKHPIDLPFEANYTYNVSKMFYDALKLKDGIRELNGKTGEECKPILESGITRFVLNREQYKKWNPDNGWGDYASALELLRKLVEWCDQAPKAIMRVT